MKNMFLSNGRCPSCKGDIQQQDGGAVCGNVKCQLDGKLLSPVNGDGEYGGHELGGTYWCGYWCDAYTVIDMDAYNPLWGWVVKSEWHGRNKRTTIHSTSLDAKWDCLITEYADITKGGAV